MKSHILPTKSTAVQPYNIPEFVSLCEERNLPVDGMRMEVVDKSEGCIEDARGIITMHGNDKFTLEWCRWHCFLVLLANMKWSVLFRHWLPYCLGLRKMDPFEVNSERGRTLQILGMK